MATWRFEIALLVLKNILLASPLTCEIFFNTQREISYLNMTLYYPLLPSPSTFPFHPFPSFLAPYPLLPTFSPPLWFSHLTFLPLICPPSPLLPYSWTSPFHLFPSFLAPCPLCPTSPHSLCSLLYLSCPHYLHPLFTSFPLQLLLSIFFLFFFPPSLSSPLLPSPFPLFPFNFSFPIFVLFFLPPDPFLPTPLHPSCSLLYLSCPLYLYASFNYFPLQLFLSIFSPFFPPSLSSSSYLFTPPSFFLIYLSCPPILPPLLSLIVLSELFKCLTSVMILCNHAVWV